MKNANKSLDLHRQILTIDTGTKYQVNIKSGQTFVQIGEDFYPVSGCLFPAELAWAKTWAFLLNNWNTLLMVGASMVALTLLQLCLAITYPGDFMGHFIASFSLWMNTALVVGFCLTATAIFVKQFMGGVVVVDLNRKEKTALIGSGEIGISPDVMVMATSEDEAAESFESRMKTALSETEGTARWVLVIAPRHGTFAVCKNSDLGAPSEPVAFLRTNPFDESPFDESQVISSTSKYKKENFEQYANYCRLLAEDFKKWASFAKMGKTDVFDVLASTMKSAAILALILFCTPAMSAQKTAQVREYLGDRADLVVPPAGQMVSYIFNNREIEVRADGVKNYVETLKQAAFFSDKDDAGRLVLVKVGKDKILPTPPKSGRVASASVEGKGIPTMPGKESVGFLDGLPDSTELQRMKAAHLAGKKDVWKKAEPVLDYYMWLFWGFMGLLIGSGALLWTISSVAATDSIKNVYGTMVGNVISLAHIWAKTWLFMIMAFVTVVFFLDGSIRYYFTDSVSFWSVAKIVLTCLVWKYVFEKILPDTPGSGKSEAYNSKYGTDQNQRRLG